MLSYYGMQTEDKHQEEIPVFLLKISLSSSRAVHCCLFSPFSSSKDLFCGQVINLCENAKRIFVKLPHSFIFGGAAEAEADVSTSFRRERETKKTPTPSRLSARLKSGILQTKQSANLANKQTFTIRRAVFVDFCSWCAFEGPKRSWKFEINYFSFLVEQIKELRRSPRHLIS